MQAYNVTNNEGQKRFEINEAGETAFLVYKINDGSISLLHTEVPDAVGGKGVGGALAAFSFDYAKDKNLQVIIRCPFVSAYVKKHSSLQSQVKEN